MAEVAAAATTTAIAAANVVLIRQKRKKKLKRAEGVATSHKHCNSLATLTL